MTTPSTASMVMTSSATAAAAAAAATGSPAAMGGGMDMGGGKGPGACKISMLWNWYTIDSCFIARSWHVRSNGAFAGSCIGVILLVLSLELLRRSQREFDRYLRQSSTPVQSDTGSGSDESGTVKGSRIRVAAFGRSSSGGGPAPHLKVWQQAVRSLLFMLQFAVGYFVMLLAMYYNGYIIICIFIGAFFGAMIFQWDTFGTLT
ncbi:MAG: Copper Transporter integral membrane protein that functions in high affinity copper transport [Caeruleum heppii]|nr:MAG: Copper Transporter integral membrane protein that functions in high affinity copper transport [Caeruleum heppii]